MDNIYFSDNPIIYTYETSLSAYITAKASISVNSDDGHIFSLEKTAAFFNKVVRFNFSDIAKSIVEPIGFFQINETIWVGNSYLFSVSITLYDINGGATPGENLSFYVTPGGISNAQFRKYLQANTNVFNARIFLTDPFLHSGDTIRLTNYTSLYCPIYLYQSSNDTFLRVDYKDANGNDTNILQTINRGYNRIIQLNVKLLLDYIENQRGIRPMAFKVSMVAGSSIRGKWVAIEEEPPTMQMRFLAWRNSWGVWEMTQLNGQAEQTIESKKEEYLQYTYNTDSFTIKNQRGTIDLLMSATSGYRTREKLQHLLDMYASPEHYLYNPEDGSITEVVLTSTEESLNLDLTTPQEHTVEWKLADVENRITY